VLFIKYYIFITLNSYFVQLGFLKPLQAGVSSFLH